MAAIRDDFFSIGPVPVDAGFRDDAWWIWCGSAARGDDGLWHLFASRWSKATAFNANWLTNSRIVRAVAERVEGPYRYVGDVLPPRGAGRWDGLMTHNPSIHRHGDTWLLYYTGTSYQGEVPTNGRLAHDDPRRFQARARQRIGLATAPSPLGPWTRREEPILEVRTGSWDAFLTTNAAPVVHGDGSVLLYYKSTEDDRGRLRYGVARAAHWSGPYRHVGDRPLFDDPASGHGYEDACVWCENDGYHMVFNDLSGGFTGEDHAGGYATSADGLDWTFRGKAYSRRLRWSDGRETVQGSLERPQVVLSDGRPSHLLAATADGPGGFSRATNTWNLVLPFRRR